MISFGQPEMLALLLLVGLIVLAGVWLEAWRRRARKSFSGPQASRWRGRVAWSGALLFLAAAVAIALAAALPRWGSRELTREREGVDLVIALDISQSMMAADVSPSRMRVAQDELVKLVEAQRGSRIGLVFFAGTAIARSPLTSDTQAITKLINRADREVGLTRTGSDIGTALTVAGTLLQSSETAGKAVLVVSDGEDHVDAFAAQLTALQEQGIAVYAAGVGTAEGGTITELDLRGQPRTKLTAGGTPVITRLDETTLRALAAGPNGRYIRLGSESLVTLQDDLASLQQSPLGSDENRVPIERFQLFAAAAFVLLALSWVAPERLRLPSLGRALRGRPAPGIAVALLALLIGGACGSSDSLRDQVGAANRLYDAGSYQEALTAYEELLAARPDVPEIAYNAGNTLNRLGEFERAVSETQRSLPPTTTKLGAASYYALGNHYMALGQPAQAYDAYRNALLLDPNDEDTKFNLELSLLQMVAPPNQPQPGEGPDGDQPNPNPSDQPAQPNPQAQPGQPNGSPSPAPGATPAPSPAEVQRSLQDALRGIDENLSFEDAIQILDLLRQQQERPIQPSQPGSPSGPDY